jgi:quercetin dioxygenase-like cupin family protein
MRLAHLKARKGEPPWFERVVLTDDQMATVICQAPGTPNERHFHSMCDEWWAILEGEITWDIEGRGVVHARRGDVVFVPRNTFHLISVVGKTPAIRLAVATPDVVHEH